MKNENLPQVFGYEGRNVTIFTIDDEKWWLAGDVCRALGTKTKDIRKILKDDEVMSMPSNVGNIDIHLDRVLNEETCGIKFKTISEWNHWQTVKGGKPPLLISLPGVFSLINKSRKPEAEKFQRWVNHDVLPAIFKTGSYGINESAEINRLMNKNQDLLIDNLSQRDKIIDSLTKNIALLEHRNKLEQELEDEKESNEILVNRCTELFNETKTLKSEIKQAKSKKNKHITAQEVEKIINYRLKGMTQVEIAKKINRDRVTVQRWLYKNGLKVLAKAN